LRLARLFILRLADGAAFFVFPLEFID